jgi:hydroxyethylthiazole kinase-like uncharacterized protein yjeF
MVGAQDLVHALAEDEPVVEHRDTASRSPVMRPLTDGSPHRVDMSCPGSSYWTRVHAPCYPSTAATEVRNAQGLTARRRAIERFVLMRVLTCRADARSRPLHHHEIGIPSIVLMENAGRQVVAAMEATFEDLPMQRVAVLAGAATTAATASSSRARWSQRGVDVSVFVVGSVAEVRGDARINLEILGRLGLAVVEITDEQDWELHFSDISACDLIVDALFGTGLHAPLGGLYCTIVADVNQCAHSVVSIDLPSGLSADSHERRSATPIEAGADRDARRPRRSPARAAARGERLCGDLVIADIGIPDEVIEGLEGPTSRLLTRDGLARELVLAAPRGAQGRLRPRPDRRRLAREDRRGPPGRDGRPALGRGARHRGDAAIGACRSWRRWRPST